MKVYLRALEMSDLDTLVKWRNDPEITSPLGGNTFYVSKSREEQWLKDALLNDNSNIRLAICIKESNIHIGNVNLTSVNWINRSAEYSIMIGDKNQWGEGYAHEASVLILRHAFYEMNLNRVFLTVREDNQRAIRLYNKIGFVREGVLRESVYKNGKYVNMIIMSLLKDEFRGEI